MNSIWLEKQTKKNESQQITSTERNNSERKTQLFKSYMQTINKIGQRKWDT
jgi:hypothetical protein